MRARYYNVNIKRFINQDVVHGSINVSQSLNRYSYVQGNPIKLTDPFGLSPLDKINWRNVGHSALNILGCINGYGFIFDGINAVWYACEGDYGMAVLSLISTLSDTGNMIAFGLKSTKFARVGQYIGAITQLVSNAATFTQAAISGLENAKAIFRNAKSGKLLSIDTASNVAALGLNLFTTIVSGKGAVTSGKNIKKMIGTDVGNKWGNKANNKPLLECNLQFFADKNGCETSYGKSSSNCTELVPYYPANNGAVPGTEKKIYLMAGDKIDRFGGKKGKFFSPTGTPMEMRALPYDADLSQYRQFEVVKPFEVEASTIAPAFENIGLGTQYRSSVSVDVLLKKGIIKQVGGN